ncbi:unnamed protein product [Adineta ricciae]|uniref:Aminopeptidase n=1 Tax=Adineta ricciae TaxID=249248 RepID=A0A814L655_ADIRI|nr:unnamed protein product [Adineta ricciae]
MASNKASTFNFSESTLSTTRATPQRFKTLRSIPKSWLIAAAIFYCASVITVGLLAGLLPRRTQQISVLATVTSSNTTGSVPITTTTGTITTTTGTITTTTGTMTTTQDPSLCVEDECNPRLSSDVIVHSYQIQYTYNDSKQTIVRGQVTIEFTLKQPIKQLIYHSKEMVELEEPALFEDEVYRFISMRTYVRNDYVSLRLMSNSLFARNRYRLVQNFAVKLTDSNVGFYQTIYKDGDNTMEKLLSTQFEPIDARRAFPCFDEPHLKAPFTITIIHSENTVALANFPSIEESLENGLRRTKFAETYPMSTYLAAWAILPDTYGSRNDNEDEPWMTVWARREVTERNHTALALEIASKSIPFYASYFNTSEPITPKIDLLAVPEFVFGAMENWGLVTFREDQLIYDEKVVSTERKQDLGETIAHELAHFWFGNYVTCQWWTDLWLNEAMATWLSYKPFADSYPSWNMEVLVFSTDIIPSMWDDARPSSHPIVVPNVTDPGEISSLFDSITYSKGASILRMLELTAGTQKFQTSLQEYLRLNALSVGDPSFFYNNLFTNMSGEAFVMNWLEEKNFPVVNVTLSVENGDTTVTFTQSRFIISNALDTSQLDANYRWKIMIKCVLGGDYPNSDTTNIGGDTIEFLFDTEQSTQVITGKSYSWIKCNRDFISYHLTQYSFPSNTYQRFANVLETNPTFFSNTDKINFLQDTFLLAYKGLIDYAEPLRLMRSLVKTNTQQHIHWKTFEWHWSTLVSLVDYLPDTLPKFQNFAIQQILSNGETIDGILTLNPTDDDNTKLLKSLKFGLLCRMNHAGALQKASELFKSIPIEYFNNSNVVINVNADYLTTVYESHMSVNDNEADWNMMYNYYRIAISPQEQIRALSAICATKNTTRLNRLLEEGLSNPLVSIKRQDYFRMIKFMAAYTVGRTVAWTFYKANYRRLVEVFNVESYAFGQSILSFAESFEKQSYFDEMNQLFSNYPNAGAGVSARKQAIDQVKMNLEWIRSRNENLLITPKVERTPIVDLITNINASFNNRLFNSTESFAEFSHNLYHRFQKTMPHDY